jgi:exopolysaccharide production protein ExoZ
LRLANLEALRFIAAAWVVTGHTAGTFKNAGETVAFFEVFSQGWAGVDLFFVISGFVIASSNLHSPKSFSNFALQRVIRIVPAYWAVTGLLLVALFASITVGIENTAFQDFSPGWLLASSLFLSQPLGFEGPFVYLGWTLEYEVLFYSIFALAILISKIRFFQAWIAIGFVLALSLFFPGELLQMEFVLGCLVAIAVQRLGKRRILGLFCLAAGVTTLLLLSTLSLDLPRFFELGLGFALIVMGAAMLPQVSSKLVLHLGSSSYAVYLLQVLTIPIAMLVIQQWVDWQSWSLVALIAIVLVNQAMASWFELGFDAPLRKRLSATLLKEKKA